MNLEAPRTTPLLITVEQAAQALAIGRSLMYTLVTGGLVRSIKIGRCRLIPAAELDRFIEAQLGDGRKDEPAEFG